MQVDRKTINNRKENPKEAKITIVIKTVKAALTYPCESWTLSNRQKQKKNNAMEENIRKGRNKDETLRQLRKIDAIFETIHLAQLR